MAYPQDRSLDVALAKVATLEEKKLAEDHDGEAYVPGSEGVTEHELATLRHVADRLPLSAWLVVFVEFAERWSYYGTTNCFSNYIRAPLPPGSTTGAVDASRRAGGVAGALGQGQQKSFAIRTTNTFFSYTFPLLGGVVADSWLGRYNTIMVSSVICLVGHIILVATSTPASLQNPSGALAGLVVSIITMALGAGGIKANVSALVAEQYSGTLRKQTLPSGEVVIVSPAVTIQGIYMWFYAAINLGACGAISAAFLARDNGYWVAFLVPTALFVLVPGVMLLGKKQYVTTPPRGSILVESFRVWGMAGAHKWSLNPVKTWKNFHRDDFWDNAKPSHYGAGEVPKKITWDDEFVGEVARTLNACKVFLWFPVFWLCYSQIDGNLATVAASMRLDGTPNDLIQNLNPISIIFLVPIFEKGVYPFLRSRGINFSPIKRIYAGFLVAGLGMLYAAVLQHFIYKMSPCHDNRPSECIDADEYPLPADISVWVVAGPYILVGLSEVFASITSLEYAFTKSPIRMKSTVVAFALLQNALAAAINFALVEINVEWRFTWLFGSFAVASWIAGTIFFWTFRALDKQEAELNQIGKNKDRHGFVDEASGVQDAERAGSVHSAERPAEPPKPKE